MIKAKKLSLKEQIRNAIISEIISGDYPAAAIINEKDLTEKYQVSKSPVRDALVELCSEDILRSIPRVGYEVIHLSERDMREIMQFRFFVESQCLPIVVESIRPEEIAQLESHLADDVEWAKSEREIVEHWQKNIEFHLLINSFAKNRYINDALMRSMNTQLRGYAQFYWDKWRQTHVVLDMQSHTLLVKAIKDRDAELAVYYLQQDLGVLGTGSAFSFP